jgi:hypothetical protein
MKESEDTVPRDTMSVFVLVAFERIRYTKVIQNKARKPRSIHIKPCAISSQEKTKLTRQHPGKSISHFETFSKEKRNFQFDF